MRIAWIIVGFCLATLAVAQMARPPDAPPVLPNSFDENLAPARPLTELPLAIQDAVAKAMAAKDCVAATAALTGAYLQEYPQNRWILADRQTVVVWWRQAGHQVYADVYACDVVGEFTAAAALYEAGGGSDFHWCGQSLLTERRPDKDAEPALYRLVQAIDELMPMTSKIRQDAPFSSDALRAILASDNAYRFVVLPESVRFNVLLILEHTSELTPDERAEFNALADEIPGYKKRIMMDFIDSGHEFGNRAEFRECVGKAAN